ncbi:MAG: hypothetical protein ABRQ38_22090 [Candidatus Eremiobacterota bacterium]
MRNSGVTLIELCIVIGIFMLFLLAFYATMDVGLKSWKIGEVRSDIKTTAETVMKRITTELGNANSVAINVFTPADPNDPNAYICFETPVYDGDVMSEPNTGDLLWQGHVIYYTLPDGGDHDFNTKMLYRRYIPHETVYPYKSSDRTVATLLDNINGNLDSGLSGTEMSQGQVIRKICTRISHVTFVHLGSIINIELGFVENFRKSRDARVSFSASGTGNIGTERYILKNSVKPQN